VATLVSLCLVQWRMATTLAHNYSMQPFTLSFCEAVADPVNLQRHTTACVKLGEVHFIPQSLMARGFPRDLDMPWNLVLACSPCNGGGGKSASLPDRKYLKRLNKRNEFLIASHHPLRETIIQATGANSSQRWRFLNDTLEAAENLDRRDRWTAPDEHAAVF